MYIKSDTYFSVCIEYDLTSSAFSNAKQVQNIFVLDYFYC